MVVFQFVYCFPQSHKAHKEISIVSKPFVYLRVFVGHFYFAEIDKATKVLVNKKMQIFDEWMKIPDMIFTAVSSLY